MKLLQFKNNHVVKLGVKTKKGILDITAAGKHFNEEIPNQMKEIITKEGLGAIERIVDRLNWEDVPSLYSSEDEIEFLPCILNPEKVICVGLNYLSHVEEAKTENVPTSPVLFNKFNNALAANNESISIPKVAEKIDYEAELVMVIGKEAKNLSEEEALSYVFGYSAGNDLSARDLQFKSGQWLLGKSLDGFAPIGPYLVTADEIDPNNLTIECRVNGELRQSSNTKNMIFNCATILSYVSKHMTLKPGDIIFTGTPEGVILGYSENEQIWLKSGDEVEIYIEKIGTLKNSLS